MTTTLRGGSQVAGSDTQVQFNDGGAFGADANLTYDKASLALTADSIQTAATDTSPIEASDPLLPVKVAIFGSDSAWLLGLFNSALSRVHYGMVMNIENGTGVGQIYGGLDGTCGILFYPSDHPSAPMAGAVAAYGDFVTYDGQPSKLGRSNRPWTELHASLGVMPHYYAPLFDISSGTAIDWTAGNVQKRTNSAPVAFTFAGGVAGARYAIVITNSGGAQTITWPASVKWFGGSVPTPSASGKKDVYTFLYDGTDYLGAAALNA